MSPTMVEIFGF